MSQGFISRALLIAFIAALAVIPLSILFFPQRSQPNNKIDELSATAQQNLLSMLSLTPSPTPTSPPLPSDQALSPIPKITLSPTYIPTPIKSVPAITSAYIAANIQSYDDTNWTTYLSTKISDAGFSFTSPQNWLTLYKRDSNLFIFFLSPSGSKQNGQIMTISLFDTTKSIQLFIDKNYPKYKDALTYEQFGNIGNKPLYKIYPKKELNSTIDSNLNSFGSRGVILGEKHAYTVSFDDNSTRDIIEQIEKKVWPSFRFE